MGIIIPAGVEPLAGTIASFTAKTSKSSVPIIKDGIETKAVVTTMINLSIRVLRRKEAIEPRCYC